MRKVFIIPVVNMSYLLKGKDEDINDIFPKAPKFPLSSDEAIKFFRKAQNKELKDGRAYWKCFNTNVSRAKGLTQLYKLSFPTSALDNVTVEQVADVVNRIIDTLSEPKSKYKHHEVVLLYITHPNKKFSNVKPLVDLLGNRIDDVMIYTDNISYSSKDKKGVLQGWIDLFGDHEQTKLNDCIKERYGKDTSYGIARIFIPYYQYYGVEVPASVHITNHCDGQLCYSFYEDETFVRRDLYKYVPPRLK